MTYLSLHETSTDQISQRTRILRIYFYLYTRPNTLNIATGKYRAMGCTIVK